MGRDEVDAGPGPAAPMVEHVARSGKARRQIGHLAFVTAPESPHGVAIPVIPLSPSGGKLTQLVGVSCQIPWLSDQFDRGKDRILLQRLKKGRIGIEDAIRIACEARPQIEAKSIDAHFLDPVAQGIGDELQDARVVQIKGVADPGDIDIAPRRAGSQTVIARVVDTSER